MRHVFLQITVWFLAGFLSLGLPACGPGAATEGTGSVEVLVRVRALLPEITALQVEAVLDGKSAMSAAEFTERLELFGVRLRLGDGGTGALRLSVTARSSDGCKVATGTVDAALTAQSPYTEVELALVPLPAKLCPLQIERTGVGTVISEPEGLDCGTSCRVELPVGTSLRLSTRRASGSFLTEWGDEACGAPMYGSGATCSLTLSTATTLRVRLSDDACVPGTFCYSDWNSLAAVWVLDASNVWAVGSGGHILKWDGSVWSAQQSGTTQDLLGVWGSDGRNVWAVGQKGTLLKWDGTAWSAQPSGTPRDLSGVWGSDERNVWAVGQKGTLLKWDGTAWSTQPSGTSRDLAAVWGSSASSAWIVGNNGVLLRCKETPVRARGTAVRQRAQRLADRALPAGSRRGRR